MYIGLSTYPWLTPNGHSKRRKKKKSKEKREAYSLFTVTQSNNELQMAVVVAENLPVKSSYRVVSKSSQCLTESECFAKVSESNLQFFFTLSRCFWTIELKTKIQSITEEFLRTPACSSADFGIFFQPSVNLFAQNWCVLFTYCP